MAVNNNDEQVDSLMVIKNNGAYQIVKNETT